jgi:hypothetical protein
MVDKRRSRATETRDKNARFELRVSEAFLRRVDEWRRRQPDLPSRASAVRQLVEMHLDHVGRRRA